LERKPFIDGILELDGIFERESSRVTRNIINIEYMIRSL